MGEITEVKKRCTTCGRYPFCNNISEPTGCCDNWVRRNIEDNEYPKKPEQNVLLVKFINLGKKKVSFDRYREADKISYKWLYYEIDPYISQDEFELKQNSKGDIEIYVDFGFIKTKQGKVKIMKGEGNGRTNTN